MHRGEGRVDVDKNTNLGVGNNKCDKVQYFVKILLAKYNICAMINMSENSMSSQAHSPETFLKTKINARRKQTK